MRQLFLLALIASSGCTAMTVNVSVLDPTKLKQTAEWVEADVVAREPVAIRVAGPEGGGKDAADRQANAFFLSVEQSLKDFQSALNKEGLSSDLEVFNYYHALIFKAHEEAAPLYRSGLDQARMAGLAKGKKRYEKFISARNSFDDGDRKLEEMRRQVAGDLQSGPAQLVLKIGGKDTPTSSATVHAAADQVVSQVDGAVDSLIGNAGVFDDPHTPLIVDAPAGAWTGTFNKTYGGGLLGNTDVAVKMQSIGNFNLKGIRVDATKVTQATFNAINLGVKLVASAYGIPLKTGSGGTSTAPGSVGQPGSATDTDAQAKLQEQRTAALAILQAIATQADNAGKNDTAAQTARAQVQAIYNAFKDQLGSPTSGQSSQQKTLEAAPATLPSPATVPAQ